MSIFISLLRGINVGGNKKIKMAELKSLYESLGLSNVKTLLQSGNVVFESENTDASQVAHQIEAGIQKNFGFESKIIIRTKEQWQATIAQHPFSTVQLEQPSKVLVMFLQNTPDEQSLKALIQAHTGTEVIHGSGQELYIFYTDGMGNSKLDTGFIERKLKITATGRNWNTVNKILTLTHTDATD